MYSSKCIVCDVSLKLNSEDLKTSLSRNQIWTTFCHYFCSSTSPLSIESGIDTQNEILASSFCTDCQNFLQQLLKLQQDFFLIESKILKIVAFISTEIINLGSRVPSQNENNTFQVNDDSPSTVNTENNVGDAVEKMTPIFDLEKKLANIRQMVCNSFNPQLIVPMCQPPRNKRKVVQKSWFKKRKLSVTSRSSNTTGQAAQKVTKVIDYTIEKMEPISAQEEEDDDDDDEFFKTTKDASSLNEMDTTNNNDDDDDSPMEYTPDIESDQEEEDEETEDDQLWTSSNKTKKKKMSKSTKKAGRKKKRQPKSTKKASPKKKRQEKVIKLAIDLGEGKFSFEGHVYELTPQGRVKCQTCGTECQSPKVMHYHIVRQHIIHSGIGKTGKKIVKKLRLDDLGDGKFLYGGNWTFSTHPIHGYACSSCFKHNKTREGMLRHIRIAHRPGNLTCESCGKRLKNQQAFQKHKCDDARTNYGQILECGDGKYIYFCGGTIAKDKQFEFESIENNKFKCSTCSQILRRKDNMCQHIKDRHAEKRIWVCETCGKSFKRQAEFKDHQSVHSDLRPFLCNDCGKTFKTQHDLRKHSRLTHQELEYKCEICGALCKTPTGLEQHTQFRHSSVSTSTVTNTKTPAPFFIPNLIPPETIDFLALSNTI